MDNWRVYKKSLVAGSGGVVLAGLAALDSTEVLHTQPWLAAGVSMVTAMGVYQVRNAKSEVPLDPLDPSLRVPPPTDPTVTSSPEA